MPLINPLEKKVCPFCYARFYLGNCEVYSSIADPNTGVEPLVSSKPAGVQRAISRFWIRSLGGELFAQKQPYRRCPNCDQPLPYNIESNENCVIGVIGGRKSSKSHYIASLIHTLRRKVSPSNIGFVIKPLTGKMQAHYENRYYKPLYVDRYELNATVPGQITPPLVYTTTFTGQNGTKPARSVNLVLFDVSGEELRDDARMMSYAKFLLFAKGIILLVDPLTIDSFVEYLPPHEKPKRDYTVDRAEDVLDSLTINLRRHRNIPDGVPIDLPIVAALAKGDLLRHPIDLSSERAALLDPNNGYRLRDVDYRRGFQVDQYQQTSEQVRGLLEDLDGPGFVDRLQHEFTNYSFSAISATGSTAVKADDTGNAPPSFRLPVIPSRCADPLLWLLYELGYVRTD
jgi:hypothetical protein